MYLTACIAIKFIVVRILKEELWFTFAVKCEDGPKQDFYYN
jgi:hypothetical protein